MFDSEAFDLGSRRSFLRSSGCGFGSLALTALLQQQRLAADETDHREIDLHATTGAGLHHQPYAKNVIFLFMEGGPSHLDTFDPKPLLNELAGQPIPDSFGEVITAMGEFRSPLLESKRKWKQHGESGTWVSDWLPHTATCVDDIAVIRSCWGNGINHSAGVCQMNTCSIVGGRPSLGSWVSYGLGTENEDLPAFVVMQDTKTSVVNGPRNWGSGFMPAEYQGVRLQQSKTPIPNLFPPADVSRGQQLGKLGFLTHLNRQFAARHPEQSELEARIASYELAFRMQAHAPEAVAMENETAATEEMYGINDKDTETFGRLCLLSRRMVERGVRFVQLYSGSGSKWDAHSGIEGNHSKLCRSVDKPIAGLLKDLKQRGLLRDTLVIWGGEFGRTPMSEKGNGRDHNPSGFTMWMAGGGVKGGQTIGATDELGLHAIEEKMHVHDLHASILRLLGLDHMQLVYNYKGRPERPTINEGRFLQRLVG